MLRNLAAGPWSPSSQRRGGARGKNGAAVSPATASTEKDGEQAPGAAATSIGRGEDNNGGAALSYLSSSTTARSPVSSSTSSSFLMTATEDGEDDEDNEAAIALLDRREGRGARLEATVTEGVEAQQPNSLTATAERNDECGRKSSSTCNPTKSRSRPSSRFEWTGQLIARILPRGNEEYDLQKPSCRIDPAQLIASLGTTQPSLSLASTKDAAAEDSDRVVEVKQEEGAVDVLSLSPLDENGVRYDMSSGGTVDEDLIVTLDLFLFGNPLFLQRQHHHGGGDGGRRGDSAAASAATAASACAPGGAPGSASPSAYNVAAAAATATAAAHGVGVVNKQKIPLRHRHSSSAESSYLRRRGLSVASSSSELSQSSLMLGEDEKTGQSPGGGGASGTGSGTRGEAVEASSHREDEHTVLCLHMKRDATETALRTLRRLEISTAKKLQIVAPKPGRGKRTRKKTPTAGNIAATQNREASSCLVVKPLPYTASGASTAAAQKDGGSICDDDDDDRWMLLPPSSNVHGHDDGADDADATPTIKKLDLHDQTSADLWRTIATRHYVTGVGLWLLNPDAEYELLASSDEESDNSQSSSSPRMHTIMDGRIPLDVISCPPTVLRVQTFEDFEARVFTGVPLVLEFELIFADAVKVTWFVDGKVVQWNNPTYTPTEEDVGKSLSVLIVPTRPGHKGHGCEEAYQYKHTVERLPFMPIVSPIRDGWTRRRLPEERDDALRVLTYNILADLYTSRDIDQHLMYSHCDLNHLMRWRRMPMLIYEILSYQADVIALQEVDKSIYETLLRPVLGTNGYQSYYSNKVTSQQEGCAMFWSMDCFEQAEEADMRTVSIRDLFDAHEHHNGSSSLSSSAKAAVQWDSMDKILDLMRKHDELRRVTREKTGQILQVATLTLKKMKPRADDDDGAAAEVQKPDKMVLSNTHLFYHPMADHIRAMQAYVVCKKVDEVRREGTKDPYPLVFCGDLNSDPMSGAVQLLFTRALLPEHHETWKHLHEYRWEMGDNEYMIEHGYVGNEDPVVEPAYLEEAFDDAHEDERSLEEESLDNDESVVHPPHIVLPASFPNLVSGCPNMPEFTNYAIDFVETLDYVLASEPSEQERYGFGPKQAAPMPSEEEVKRYVAMPNEFMPSDHVSVVCDLEWKERNASSWQQEGQIND